MSAIVADKPQEIHSPDSGFTIDLSGYPEFAGRKRWTRESCELFERLGEMPARYELLDGEVIEKMGQNRPHAVTIVLLIQWLISIFGADHVQCQLPIEVASTDQPYNQPEPDASVISRPATSFLQAPPGPGDIRLVVEVSDTTLSQDIRIKSALYARSGIPEYWIIDIPSQGLIVQSDPGITGGIYRSVRRLSASDTISPQAAPESSVKIADLLPPVQAQTT